MMKLTVKKCKKEYFWLILVLIGFGFFVYNVLLYFILDLLQLYTLYKTNYWLSILQTQSLWNIKSLIM